MIKPFYHDDIINRLGAAITFGLDKRYSYRAIEERIAFSSFINGLENNEYDSESKIEKIVEDIYSVGPIKDADISFKGLFIAESYFRLFLHFNKSFEYLFLYWPLEAFVNRYNVYHEMDFSNLRNDFENEVKKTTLLRKLLLDRDIKLVDISKLTGINENTVVKYSRDDEYLYSASYGNIYKLAKLFGVKENIFVSSLSVYDDQSIYLIDNNNKIYNDYLGYYFANYFDKRISEETFAYDKEKGVFVSNKGKTLVVIADKVENLSIERINNISNSNTYVVIIPFGSYNETSFACLKDAVAMEIFVLTKEFVYMVKKDHSKEITDTVNRSLLIRSKESISSL